MACWLPKWMPKPSQISKKSFEKWIRTKSTEFLKNSTSPTPEAHFGGSRVPKQLSKPTKSIEKADQESRVFLHGFLDLLCLHSGSSLGPPGLPWRAKVSKKALQSHPKRTKKAAKTGIESQEPPRTPRTRNYPKILPKWSQTWSQKHIFSTMFEWLFDWFSLLLESLSE